VRLGASPLARGVGLLLLLTMTFAGVLATAPLWAPGSAVAAASRFAFSTLCHQLPWRSFRVDGCAMAICHRCTGIYAGVGLGGLLAALGLRVDPRNLRVWVPLGGLMLAQVVAGWITDALDLWPLRVTTGVLLGGWGGLALASAFDRGARYRSDSRDARSRATTSPLAP
jgi:uncharacterized membrane protein